MDSFGTSDRSLGGRQDQSGAAPGAGRNTQLLADRTAGIPPGGRPGLDIRVPGAQGNAPALGAQSAHVNSGGWLPTIESLAMVEGLLYALLFAPELVRRKLPFQRASGQALRLIPAALATVAMLITGLYLLALHFFDEPLAKLPPGPLAASILAVMALLTPLYQVIARACWRYGLADLLDPAAWWAQWSQVRHEITTYRAHQAARERPADAEDRLDQPV